MKKLTIKVETEDTHELINALQYAIKQIEKGNTTIDLRNEDIESGYCKIEERSSKK